LKINEEHLVSIPVISDLHALFTFPKFNSLANYNVWIIGVTVAIIASLETLLNLEAVGNIDPHKRKVSPNMELIAQGYGNLISGLFGGIPITSVIVRSSVNINAGAISKKSTILHGIWLVVSIMLLGSLLNKIPLSSLAAILILTGYKLISPKKFIVKYKKGWNQFIPFVATIIAILFTDLLVGILLGIVVSLLFLVYSNFRSSISVVIDKNNYLFRLRKDVSFLNKPILKTKLEHLPENSYVLIDATQADFIDNDIIDVINEFKQHAGLKNIQV
jgi:MFS superfamily sulfate permease-like transporter